MDSGHTATVETLLGVPLERLLEPISTDQPSGDYLRGNGVYSSIRDARHQDHALSQGVWQHDLKQADWDRVSQLALDALHYQSKDLQIGFWLLEAQIHRHGFAGVAPSLALLRELCERYWDTLHPQIQDGDLDYRINPVLWANEKLLPVLRLVPLTAATQATRAYTWADWELAQRNDAVKEKKGKLEKGALAGADFVQALHATPTETCRQTYRDIRAAIGAIEDFTTTLDRLCGKDAPSLSQLTRLLQEIAATLDYLSAQRGIRLAAAESATEAGGDSSGGAGGDGPPPPGNDLAIDSRQHAYELLGRAAEFLMRTEPHSPAPYLVKKAIQWGNLSTPELYQELFVRYQGQLNIFEVLGLELNADK